MPSPDADTVTSERASPLRALQRAFHRYITQGDHGIDDAIDAPDDATRATRLGVYGDAYYLRLAEALQSDFTAVHKILGDVAFAEMTRQYASTHPSEHPSIRWFGNHLAEFIAATPPYADQPALPDMAQFEWALSLCFDAPDAETLDVDAFATIPAAQWPSLAFEFHPSLQRLDLAWNAPVVWKALNDHDDDSDHADDDGNGDVTVPDPVKGEYPTGWLIWRGELNPQYRSLEVHEAWMLDAARQGMPFAALCDGLTEWIDPQHAAPEAAGQLKRWVVDGLLTSVRLAED
jgi:hypothetical protein